MPCDSKAEYFFFLVSERYKGSKNDSALGR